MSRTSRRAWWLCLGMWAIACELNPQPDLPVSGGTNSGAGTTSGNQAGTGTVNIGGSLPTSAAGSSSGGAGTSTAGTAAAPGGANGGEPVGGESNGGETGGGAPDNAGAAGESPLGAGNHG